MNKSSNDNLSGEGVGGMNQGTDVTSGPSASSTNKHASAPAPVTLPREERNGEDNMD